MPLTCLPNELLDKIVSKVDLKSDLLSLTKTCRLINAISTPFLYSNVGSDDIYDCKWPFFLLRTILDRPDLAGLSKVFSCDTPLWSDSPYSPPLSLEGLSPAAWTAIRAKVMEATACRFWANNWLIVIFSKTCEESIFGGAITALLLCLLPNLKEIKLDQWPIVGACDNLESLFERAIELQRQPRGPREDPPLYSMSKLVSVSIGRDDSEEAGQLSTIVTILQLPSIKKLIGRGIINNERDDETYGVPRSFRSKVEDLNFDNTVMYAENLKRLLRSCRSLRRFSFVPSESMEPCSIAAMNGLMTSKNTLQYIELAEADLADLVAGGSQESGPPFSFAKFTSLKEMVVSAYMILDFRVNEEHQFGPEREIFTNEQEDTDNGTNDTEGILQRVPRSLEVLKLTACSSCRYTELQAVMTLVRQKNNLVPNLRHVELEWLQLDSPVPKEMIGSGLIEECRKAGVILSLSDHDALRDQIG